MDSATVAAIATPILPSGIGIIRISGPESLNVLLKLTGRKAQYFAPRALKPATIYSRSGDALDRCLAVYMPSPGSYTGEDVIELHCHGSPPLLQGILEEVLNLGVSPAGPGEFTKRAFLNGKLDLAQAEAVLAMVNAPNLLVAQTALKQLEGEFSLKLLSLEKGLTSLLAEIEGALDFPEDVELNEEELRLGLKEIISQIEDILIKSQSADQAARPLRLVIAGKPNVGKSSLLNALLGEERAIVTPIPGTTRDSVEEEIRLEGVTLRLVDTAGLGKAKGALDLMGQKRTKGLLEQADLVIFLVDISREPTGEDYGVLKEVKGRAGLLVGNKRDLGESPEWLSFPEKTCVKISALTGEGLSELRQILSAEALKLIPGKEELWYLSLRQKDALRVSRETLLEALSSLSVQPLDIVCDGVRSASRALGQLTGKEIPPRVIEEIFSRFCVGK